MAARPNVNVTTLTPPSVEVLCKTCQVTRSDTTAFEAFSLPAGVIVAGAYVLSTVASDANSTAVIHVGSNPGTTNEVLVSFDVKGATGQGYNPAAAAGGTKMGLQLTADTLIKAKYVETGTVSTGGGPWLVKVEYYFPQPGMTY